MQTNQDAGIATQACALLDYIAENLNEVAGMEKPLDTKQAIQLIRSYGYDEVKSQFEKMENYRNLKNYRSAFLTCMKWFEMDIKKGYFTAPAPEAIRRESELRKFCNDFINRHPVGSEFTTKNGETMTVVNNVFVQLQSNNRLMPISNLFNNNNGGKYGTYTGTGQTATD